MNITNELNFILNKKGWEKVKSDSLICKNIKKISKNNKEAINYIAKLNVPSLPKIGKKEIVLGTTKHLLPYYILTDYFITFAFDTNIYTENLNTILIDCIGNGYFESNLIRIVTTPDDIIDKNTNELRIIGKEIKYLIDNFPIKIYKLKETKNIYYITLSSIIVKRKDIAKFTFEDIEKSVDNLTLEHCKDDKCMKYAIINQPVLMTDIIAFNKNKINKSLKSEDFYNIDNRLTIYNNVELLFNQFKYNKIFGPNIDTILFCSAIDKFYKNHNINHFLEIGIGSGYISKYIANKNNDIKGTLIDIESQAIEFAKTKLDLPNTLSNKWTNIIDKNFIIFKQNNFKLIEGDALKLIFLMINNKWDEKYDLIICNPPYIPKTIEEKDVEPSNKKIAKNFFEGTYLMRYILKNLDNITSNSIIIILSSTSFKVPYLKDELLSLIKKGWNISILLQRKVPLKVYNNNNYIHNNKDWVDFLLNKSIKTIKIGNNKFKCGAILYDSKKFPLYHIVYIVHISKL